MVGLTNWGRVTHICIGNLTIIGSDNGMSPGWHQAIIWTNDGILLIRPLGTHCCEIWIEILTFLFRKMRLKVSSAKWRPFCLCFNVLKDSTSVGIKILESFQSYFRRCVFLMYGFHIHSSRNSEIDWRYFLNCEGYSFTVWWNFDCL